MQRFIDIALDNTIKSNHEKFKHGAVCILGGKIISTGYNKVSEPYELRVQHLKGRNRQRIL